MAENLLDAEICEIKALAERVSGCADAIRAHSNPGLDLCSSGVTGSDIAAACAGKQQECSTQKERAAGRLEQFEDICRKSGTLYLNTEDEIAGGFAAMGSA